MQAKGKKQKHKKPLIIQVQSPFVYYTLDITS